MTNTHDITFATLKSMEQLLKEGWYIIFHEVVEKSRRGVLCQSEWTSAVLNVLHHVGLIDHDKMKIKDKMVEAVIHRSCTSDCITLTIWCEEMPRFRGIEKLVGQSQ
jgi:hypothetical protein